MQFSSPKGQPEPLDHPSSFSYEKGEGGAEKFSLVISEAPKPGRGWQGFPDLATKSGAVGEGQGSRDKPSILARPPAFNYDLNGLV